MQLLEKLMRQFGTGMTLVSGQTRTKLRGFLQRTGSESVEAEFCPLGQIPQGKFLYLGPAAPMAKPGDVLELDEKQYLLKSAEPVRLGDKAIYCRGICTELGGGDAWGTP